MGGEAIDAYRAACAQLQIGPDRDANLAKCLAAVDRAAAEGARLVALPELCNLPGPFPSREAAWAAAEPLPGTFHDALVERAARHGLYLAFNILVRGAAPDTFITTFLADPAGRALACYAKQVLFARQADWCRPGDLPLPVVDTPLGRIGLYVCMDGLIPESTRVLAVLGAQVLINPLNTAGPDEPDLHVPARAAEARAWMLAPNKVGPLADAHAARYAGGSAIAAPDGTLVARASEDAEEIVYATIEPARADDKMLPGGDDLLRDRRPATYSLLTAPRDQVPAYQQPAASERPVGLAAVQCSARGPADRAVLDRALALAERAVAAGARVLVLPEAFLWAAGEVAADPAAAAERSRAAVERFAALCARRGAYAALNVVEAANGARHNTLALLGPRGLVGRYRQTHVRAADRVWATPGDDYPVFDTEVGRLGLMLGYDGLFPEVARILALQGAEAILYPCAWRVPYEPRLLVVERAAENHVALVAACRPDAPVPEGSRILPLTRYPCEPHWKIRYPQAVALAPGVEDILLAAVDLGAAAVKLIAHRTDLVADRRPEYYDVLAAVPAPVG